MIRGFLIGLFLIGLCAPAAPQAARPNFVIMMTDDQRYDAMSCAGNPILRTPNMDRIARGGVRFRNMFVTNSLCAPSRASILTGMYSHSSGVRLNEPQPEAIRPDLPILPDHLRAAGYEVAFCGKSHVSGALRDRKWDYYFGYRGQGRYIDPIIAEGTDGQDKVYPGWIDDVVTDHALAYVRRKHNKPFCLFLWFKAPHRPWTRAPRHRDLFAGVTIPKPATYDEPDRGDPGKPRAFAEADNKIGSFPDVPSLDAFLKDYYSVLVGVDENVGRVLDALKETGQEENTAVFYTSDNGFFAGEWRMFDKRLMHEPSIRVPMLMRYPKLIRPGTTLDQMALNIDIAPTVLDLAGVPIRPAMHGRSWAPLLRGQKTHWRKDWLYEYYEFPGSHSVKKNRGIRTDRYKLIHYYEEPQEWELYDVKEDPGELHNLYRDAKHARLVEQLKKRLDELRSETGDPDLGKM